MQFSAYILIIAAVFGASQAASNLTVCWRDAYTRGLGSVPNYCPEGTERQGPFCYPNCKSNYTGVGPVCFGQCPQDYYDLGAVCVLPTAVYSPCPWYDLCGLGQAKGCRGNCSAGYHDDGCTCRRPARTETKESYGRGNGEEVGCESPYELQEGLCYDACKQGFYGAGPVCFQNGSQSKEYEFECGPFAYAASKEDCDNLNYLLEKAGFTSVLCAGSLAATIVFQHVVGPPVCRDLIKNVLPTLANTPVCSN